MLSFISRASLLCLPLLLALRPGLQMAHEPTIQRAYEKQPVALSLIVMDVSTYQPVNAVLVREMGPDEHTVLQAPLTGENGRVRLLATGPVDAPLLLHLSHPAYEPLMLRRSAARLQADTLFMTPVVRELPGVTVRASDIKTTVLSTVSGQPRHVHALVLIPGVSLAIYLQAPAGPAIAAADPSLPTTISQVRLRFMPATIRQGGLRLRLLAAPTPDGSAAPQRADLMTPIELTTPLLAQAMSSAEQGELIVDLSFAKLTMPADGVYVVFEALLTKPGEQFISTTIVENEAVGFLNVLYFPFSERSPQTAWCRPFKWMELAAIC